MKKTLITATIIFSACSSVMASETQIGRYTSVSNTPSFAQQNLLATEIKVNFPKQVQTIHEALTQLLVNSGYRLSQQDLDVDINVLYEQPLPDVHRWLGPVALREALQTLAGESWELKTNPVDRTVTFKLKESFRHYVRKNKPLINNHNLKLDTENKSWACDDGYLVNSTSPIYFGPNSFSLNYKDKQKLTKLAKKAQTLGLGLAIKSYADPSGPEEMHIALSKARGDSIVDFFNDFGLGDHVISNEALGATYPNPDQPISRQRVSEISLVQNLCENKVPEKEWIVEPGKSLEDQLRSWVNLSEDWKNLVYDVKNRQGDKVHIFFHHKSQVNGSFKSLLEKVLIEVQKRPEVQWLKVDLYQGDKTVVIKGVVTGVSK